MRKINHYLASANTNENFVCKFNFINNNNSNPFMFILKGGPGTGKSTLMKKIGKHFENIGEDVEYFYCSSDLDSLDGVRLPSHNICVVDGTAPHTMDATIPKVTEEIVDLGTCIKDEVSIHKPEIQEFLRKKNECFKKAYSYLNAVGIHSKTLFMIEKQDFKERTSLKTVNQIIQFLNLSRKKPKGVCRELFISAFSKCGEFELTELNKFQEIHFVCENLVQADFVLKNMKNKLNALGYNTTAFMNLINPETIKYLKIDEYDVIVKPSFVNKSKTNEEFFLEELINNLTKQVGENLSNAKFWHKKVEEFYIQNMNFDGLNKITENLIGKIENKTQKE